MSLGLEIQTDDSGEERAIRLSGELDMESSPRLIEIIRKSLNGAKALSIDLGAVSYMDSSGIAVLVQGCKLSHRQDVDFSLIDPSPQARAVIELSQLHKFFRIVQSGESE